MMTPASAEKPERLYKCQPYSVRSVDNLKNRILWFSKPSAFNDPFDCTLPLTYDFSQVTQDESEEAYEHWCSKDAGRVEEFERTYSTAGLPNQAFRQLMSGVVEKHLLLLTQKADTWGVTCFSEKVDDLLMWSHYSQGHTGFCLEFDTSFEPFNKVYPVVYRQELPKLDLPRLLMAEVDPFITAIIRTKYQCWEYEKEWRVIHQEANKEFCVDVSALTGVYFGCKMPFVHKEVICLLLAGSPTQFYEMRADKTQFAVHPTKLDYTPFYQK